MASDRGDPARGGAPSLVDTARRRVGSSLNAKWQIDALVGVGGMATVFAATHRTGARAALKVLHAEFARDDRVRARFLREGRIANTVDHPARVAVTDDDVSDQGEAFLVMDLLDGESLDHTLAGHGGRLPMDEVFGIFDPVLDLLARCHEVQIVHRDIKPANIFVCRTGAIKVLDFGVARMREPQGNVQDATSAGTILGSAAYMAPEQALGSSDLLDGRADIFSVGACVFQALSGTRLNQARTVAEQFVLAATQPAPSLATMAPEIPVEVVAFVDRALAYDRARRFPDAQAMRRELAGLRAALRAGSLSTPWTRRAGVVARQNETLDEGIELTDQSRAAASSRLQGVWRVIGMAMATARQYGWLHPQTARAMDTAYQEIGAALVAGPEFVRWEITPYAFTFDEAPVWEPERAPFDRIPYDLFATGLRRIQFKPGLTEEELRDFVAILLRQASGVDDDEDSVTAFWDRRFEHLAYLAVDSFAGGSLEDRQTFETSSDEIAALARAALDLDHELDGRTLEAQALSRNLASSIREAGEAAAALATDVPTRAALGAQAALSSDRWQERFLDAFVHAYLAGDNPQGRELLVVPLAQWGAEQSRLHKYTEVFALYAALGPAFTVHAGEGAARVHQQSLGRAIFTAETLGMMVSGLAEEQGDAVGDEGLITGLAEALAAAGDGSLFDLVAEKLETCRSPRVREVFVGYVGRWAPRHEARMATLVATVGQDLALLLLKLTADDRSPGASVVYEGALESPHARVRGEAIGLLARSGSERNPVRLQKLLDDPDPANRMDVLRTVTRLGLLGMGPVTQRKVEDPGFHDLSLQERREWLTALVRLVPDHGLAQVIGMLDRWRVVPEPLLEGTRVAAARVLGESASPEAERALRRAARRVWWNTPPVREAAVQGLQALQASAAQRAAAQRPDKEHA